MTNLAQPTNANQNRLGIFVLVIAWVLFNTFCDFSEISEETDEMRRQSNRYSCVMPGEQQITQYLIENPLINAILDDDEEKVNQLIRLGFRTKCTSWFWLFLNPIISAKEYDITKPDSERQTALHYAAFIGNPEVCRALIRHGSQVDPKDQDGFTPLHRACAADRNEAVDILIEVSQKI